jgi:predicted metal-dependent hydrolase
VAGNQEHPMTLPSEHAIQVRRLRLALPDRVPLNIVPDDPFLSRMLVGLSLLMPYLEPYLVRTMHAAKAHVKDAALARDMALFSEQEGQHFRQHKRFNEVIRPPQHEAALCALEQAVDADYRLFTAERSLRFNLAYAEGFEAMTTAVALFSVEQRVDEAMIEPAGSLFRWHALEELEHRNVAFDAYHHLYGGYGYRLAVGLFAQLHMARFITRAARVLAIDQPAASGPSSRNWNGLAVRYLIPRVLATYAPWYTPRRIELGQGVVARAEHLKEQWRSMGLDS